MAQRSRKYTRIYNMALTNLLSSLIYVALVYKVDAANSTAPTSDDNFTSPVNNSEFTLTPTETTQDVHTFAESTSTKSPKSSTNPAVVTVTVVTKADEKTVSVTGEKNVTATTIDIVTEQISSTTERTSEQTTELKQTSMASASSTLSKVLTTINNVITNEMDSKQVITDGVSTISSEGSTTSVSAATSSTQLNVSGKMSTKNGLHTTTNEVSANVTDAVPTSPRNSSSSAYVVKATQGPSAKNDSGLNQFGIIAISCTAGLVFIIVVIAVVVATVKLRKKKTEAREMIMTRKHMLNGKQTLSYEPANSACYRRNEAPLNNYSGGITTFMPDRNTLGLSTVSFDETEDVSHFSNMPSDNEFSANV